MWLTVKLDLCVTTGSDKLLLLALWNQAMILIMSTCVSCRQVSAVYTGSILFHFILFFFLERKVGGKHKNLCISAMFQPGPAPRHLSLLPMLWLNQCEQKYHSHVPLCVIKNKPVIFCILNKQNTKMISYPGAAEGTRGQTCGCSANWTRPVTDSKIQSLPSRLTCKH